MSALRNCSILLNICHRSLPSRSRCWQLLVAARSELRGRDAPALCRCFSHSSGSSGENTKEDVLPAELAEMRLRVSKLHNVVSSEGVTLKDYQRSSNEQHGASNSTFLNDDTAYDQSEDCFGQDQSLAGSIGKGLRTHKDVDVLLNMPYGHVRFDSMNRQSSKIQPASERNDVVEGEVPSVKIVKDGRYVFSVNALEDSEERLELACGDTTADETCQADSRKGNEMHDEQHFDDVPPQTDNKQGNTLETVRTNSESCDGESNIFDEQYFGDALQDNEHKRAVRQEEDDKQGNSAFAVKPGSFGVQHSSDVQQHKEQKETNFTRSKRAKNSTMNKSETGHMKPNIFEEQYFGAEKQQSQSIGDDFVEYKHKRNKPSGSSGMTADAINDEKLSLVDEEYFGSYMQTELASSWEAQEDDGSKGVSSKQTSHNQQDDGHLLSHSSIRFQQHSTCVRDNESIAAHEYAPVWKEVEDIIRDSVRDEDSTVVVESVTQREMKARTRPQADVENPKTAYDLSRKLRQEQQKKQSTDKNQQTLGNNLNPQTGVLH